MEETFSWMFIIQGFFCLLFLTIGTVWCQHLYWSLLSNIHPQTLFSSTISIWYLIIFKYFHGVSVNVFWLDSACFTLVMQQFLHLFVMLQSLDECALCLIYLHLKDILRIFTSTLNIMDCVHFALMYGTRGNWV